jgi:DNA polymerase III, delta subunit
MLSDLLLNERTKEQSNRYLEHQAHALLITGPLGSGKYALARVLASSMLGLGSAKELDSYPYFIHLLTPEGKQEIPIEAVRTMISSLNLKVPTSKKVSRVIIIENAEQLSGEAQNALLKQLEEPPLGTVLILTTTSEQAILPTVLSRTQRLVVYPVTKTATRDYFLDKYDTKAIDEAWYLSGGAFGLLNALLVDSGDHPLKVAVEEVKLSLSQTTYQRLLGFEQLSRDKNKLSLVLEAAVRVLAALHRASVSAGDEIRASKLVASRKLVIQLQQRLDANTNPRLIALQLALSLRT